MENLKKHASLIPKIVVLGFLFTLPDCKKPFIPEEVFPIEQTGGTVERRPENLEFDKSVLSPVIIIEPLLDCGKSVTVRGFITDAMVRIYRNTTPTRTLIGSGVGGDSDGQTFLVAPDLVAGDEIVATQEVDGLESPPSEVAVVKTMTEAYPSGVLPKPNVPYLPHYNCGIATYADNLPSGGTLRIFARTPPSATRNLIGQIVGCGPGQSIGVAAFQTGDEITAEAQICTLVSPLSDGHTVQPAPTTIPVAQVADIYDQGRRIVISHLLNGAKVTISRGGTVIGGGGAPSDRVNFGLSVVVSAGNTLEIVQDLCGNTSTTTTTVKPCSELPAAIIQAPRAGDVVVHVLNPVAGSRIQIFASGQEIGDGGGSQIALIRPLNANEPIVVVQSVGSCISDEVYKVTVGRGLTDPLRTGPCGEIARLEYGHKDDPNAQTTDISAYFNTPAFGAANAERLHAQVRYPAGPGPYPLVLIVHGNAGSGHPSHEGYEYLLEHFAKHCMIAVSIDENFLNGNTWGEMDARAIVLLRHLQLWREWNQTPGNPFFGKVDMQKIGLAGHSRGGEAICVAHRFNQTLHNAADPDHDFNFNISALYAIAPVDGQLQSSEGGTYGGAIAIAGSNYYVMHGSHDGDVSDFGGHKMYDRAFPVANATAKIKGLLFIFGANHGKWNTVWEAAGGEDVVPPNASAINGTDQKTLGKSYMTAFWLETLKGRTEYRYFLNGEATFASLPAGTRVTQFQDPTRVFVNHYQEDNSTVTGSFAGVTNSTSGGFVITEERTFNDFSSSNYFLGSDGSSKGWVAAWQEGASAELHILIPSGLRSIADDREFLAMQAGQTFENPANFNTAGIFKNFAVQLIFDGTPGPEVDATFYARFPYPLATSDDGADNPKSVLQTVRIPMEKLREGIPTNKRPDVTEIILKFNRQPKGQVAVDEIQFTD